MNEDRARRYHRLKRQASIFGLIWSALLLAVLLASGISLSMREAAEALAIRLTSSAWQPAVTVLGYVVLLSAVNELGTLPLSFYSGFLLERRYELSTEKPPSWLLDQAKAFGIGSCNR